MFIFEASDDNYFYLGAEAGLEALEQIDHKLQQLLTVQVNVDVVAGSKPNLSCELRVLNGERGLANFPSGLYVNRSSGRYRALVLTGASSSKDPYSFSSLFVNRDPAVELFSNYDDLWQSATAPDANPPFQVGDWAILRDWDSQVFVKISGVDWNHAGYSIEIDHNGTRWAVTPERLEKISGDPLSPETWRRQTPANGTEFLRTIAWAKLKYPLTNMLYSFAATKTVFRPYQFLPALKMLRSQRGRILIADEVGLGKTIEAGLIWTELEQRERLQRVLVIAPSSLLIKWREEMRERFIRELKPWKINDLLEYLDNLRYNPDMPMAAVMSLESLRSKQSVLDRLEESELEFDLVIMDEAHAFRNRGTQSSRLAQIVADNSKYLVLLSATPLNLGVRDLFNLMNLLEPYKYPDYEVFTKQLEPNRLLLEAQGAMMQGDMRRAATTLDAIPSLAFGESVAMRPAFGKLRGLAERGELSAREKAEVNHTISELHALNGELNRTRKADTNSFQAIRESQNWIVEWTDEEMAFYRAIRDFNLRKAARSNTPSGFLLQMPLRQACSSIPVAIETMRDKNLLVEEFVDGDEALSLEDDEIQEFKDAIGTYDGKIVAPKVDTKFDAFLAHIRELQNKGIRQALVFTFFRGTVTYLEKRLKDSGIRTVGIHGGISPKDRYGLIRSFRRGEFEIMVANQVGSEGLDFEFCNVLINYDLPWNPMQVEQRIGRLDRYGQKHPKILIYNMVVRGTIEAEIFQRLYDRIKIFTSTVGQLDQILQGQLEGINKLVADPDLSPEQTAERIERLALAVETEQRILEQVQESKQALSIIDQLEVEGLSEDGPGKGRYMSTSELQALLNFLIMAKGGEFIVSSENQAIGTFRGNDAIAHEVSRAEITDTGSDLGREILPALRKGEPIRLVFDARQLGELDNQVKLTDIVSARHPLIRLAVKLMSDPLLLKSRFSELTLANSDLHGDYAAMWTVFKSKGVDERSELLVTAIDMSSGERSEEVEEFLLSNADRIAQSVASGSTTLNDSDIAALKSAMVSRFLLLQEERQQENEAILLSRKEAERSLEERKLRTSQTALESARRNQAREKIIKLHEAKVARSETRLFQIDEEFMAKQEVRVERTNVALLKVRLR